MKKFKKLSILSFGLTVPLVVGGCTWGLYSNNNKNDQEIILFAPTNYVEVGSSLQISISSHEKEITQYKWSVDTPNDDIYITQTGILFASESLAINDNVFVTVKAVNIENPTISGSIKITVIPKNLTTNFFGFEGGVIHSYDVYKHPISVKVVRDPIDKNIYRLERPLDFMQLEGRDPTSWVTFTPVIRKSSSKLMKWNYVRPETTTHDSLHWIDYENDTETDEFPKFDITSSILLKDKFEISFLCDENNEETVPKLIVDFNIWMATDTPPMFAYLPPTKDSHTLEIAENEGKYNMQCFCPSTPGKLTYSNTIEGLYCFKNLHEYCNYTFAFELNENLPLNIKNSFSYKVSYVKLQREFDSFPMYKISFWYSFDMTNMPSSKECDYEAIYMGQIQAINDNPDPWKEGWIQFNIQWI